MNPNVSSTGTTSTTWCGGANDLPAREGRYERILASEWWNVQRVLPGSPAAPAGSPVRAERAPAYNPARNWFLRAPSRSAAEPW
ncbi:hypothetical protein HBB16_10490 [Pseudonocardia sp. MCCB 268]|nr:hypothetical protein [Pseudonocardia cytotoxica]